MKNQSVTLASADERRALAPQMVFTATAFQALFWKPRFTVGSPALAHVPLLFWLTAVIRGGRAAVIGCDDGVLHFALCQALEKLVGSGKCHGYGYWTDSKGKAPHGVPAKLRAHEEMLYEGISDMRAGVSVGEAIEEVVNEPVDLLCVNFDAIPDAAVVDAEALLSAIGDTGVLMLHGTNGASQRPHDGRSLQRVIRSSRHVEFEGGKGAIVIIKGDSVPPPLQSLLDSISDGKVAGEVGAVFRRTGQGLLAEARSTAIGDSRARAEKVRVQTEAALAEARESLANSQEGQEIRAQKIIELQAELFDLREKLAAQESTQGARDVAAEEQRARNEALKADLLELQAGRVDSHEELETLRSQHEKTLAELNQTREQLEAERNTRIEELVELTRISEEWRARSNVHKKELLTVSQATADSRAKLLRLQVETAKLKKERKRLQRLVKELGAKNEVVKANARMLRGQLKSARQEEDAKQARIAALESRVGELLASTSWKLTRPVRWIKTALRQGTQ